MREVSENRYRSRFCYRCKRQLNFDEFYNTNCSVLTKIQAISLWENPIIEFYCCGCYHSQCDIHYEERKVILIGLQNSGKTALANIIHDQCLNNAFNLMPTKGKQIHNYLINAIRYYVWDLGGVEAYRERILKQKDLIFSDCNELLYLIDVQDCELFDLSIKFLSQVVEILKKDIFKDTIEENLTIYVLFHKSDPGVMDPPKILNKISTLLNGVNDVLHPLRYSLLKTSIFHFKRPRINDLLNQDIPRFGSLITNLFTAEVS